MRLSDRWRDPAVVAEAAAAWRARPNLRLTDLLADDAIAALHDAVAALPHPLEARAAPDFAYQYGAVASPPEDACDHVWCQFARWWWTEGVALASAITGRALAPPADRALMSTRFRRGSYLDPHNDHDGARVIAYVVGLTRASWPAEHGGQLEFLAVEDGQVVVTERRAPGWNTLDLFDVTGTAHLHQVSIVTADVERRALPGWFYGP
ncbi:MAG: 2OG-Fe(II) oxygenase [Kofleriaceae bacterium]|nr:2OG-Fe(II) oxygenase [Kofleriaceae bacterium]MBP9172680.1 2OG-Fe(II) oxygenase [Kofleriaceae bacterium]MBP9862090.1 2OG-Fe(II) oxygenase [Kofleriaceae bacterium]